MLWGGIRRQHHTLLQDIYVGQRTLQLRHVVLFGPERPCAGRLITQEVQAETIDDIDDLFAGVVETLFCFLGRGICANVKVLAASGDFLAVDFVYRTLLLDQIVGVGDNLIASDDVLYEHYQHCSRAEEHSIRARLCGGMGREL